MRWKHECSTSSEKLKAIRAILFDKDGTLIDFDRTWFTVSWNLAQRTANGDEQRARSLLDAGGYDWEASRFRANSVIAAGTVEDIVQLWHPDIDEADIKAKINEFDTYTVAEGARSAVAIEGLRETLETLREMGYRLGIATNDSEAGAHATAKALGIDHLFEVVIGYDTAARPKPYPDPLLYFAERSDLHQALLRWWVTICTIWKLRKLRRPVLRWVFSRATAHAKRWSLTQMWCLIPSRVCLTCSNNPGWVVKRHPAANLSFLAKGSAQSVSGRSRDGRLADRRCSLANTSAAQLAHWYDS